jgi:hypothetical protein
VLKTFFFRKPPLAPLMGHCPIPCRGLGGPCTPAFQYLEIFLVAPMYFTVSCMPCTYLVHTYTYAHLVLFKSNHFSYWCWFIQFRYCCKLNAADFTFYIFHIVQVDHWTYIMRRNRCFKPDEVLISTCFCLCYCVSNFLCVDTDFFDCWISRFEWRH